MKNYTPIIDDFKKIFIDGVPAGDLIEAHSIILEHNPQKYGLIDVIKFRLSLYFKYFKSKNLEDIIGGTSIIRQKSLLTIVSPRPHLFELNNAILKFKSNKDGFAIWIKNRQIKDSCNNLIGANFIIGNDFLKIKPKKWKKLFNNVRITLLKVLWKHIIYGDLSLIHGWAFYDFLVFQTKLYSVYSDIFKIIKPKNIVVEYDHHASVVAMVHAAKSINIPTYTHQHGIFNSRKGFVPLIADKVMVWGEFHKKKLIEWKVPKDYILVTGAPQFTIPSQTGKERIDLFSLNLSEGEMVLTFLSNPIGVQNNMELIRLFDEIKLYIEQYHSVKALIKLHPSESKEDYIEFINTLTNYIIVKDEYTLSEVLGYSNVAFMMSSGAGLEAIIYGLPLFLLHPENSPIAASAQSEFADVFKCPVIRNKDDFARMFIYNNNFVKLFKTQNTKQQLGLKSYCDPIGEEATANVVKVIAE